MNRDPHGLDAALGASRGTAATYILGFVLSLELTLAAYLLTVSGSLTSRLLIASIIGLGVVQLLVQLVFFLQLGKESKPRWNLVVFLFMLIVLLILVLGSLWIMYSLNYHVASPAEIDKSIMHDEGIER